MDIVDSCEHNDKYSCSVKDRKFLDGNNLKNNNTYQNNKNHVVYKKTSIMYKQF
jgi:hypothetical protein